MVRTKRKVGQLRFGGEEKNTDYAYALNFSNLRYVDITMTTFLHFYNELWNATDDRQRPFGSNFADFWHDNKKGADCRGIFFLRPIDCTTEKLCCFSHAALHSMKHLNGQHFTEWHFVVLIAATSDKNMFNRQLSLKSFLNWHSCARVQKKCRK